MRLPTTTTSTNSGATCRAKHVAIPGLLVQATTGWQGEEEVGEEVTNFAVIARLKEQRRHLLFHPPLPPFPSPPFPYQPFLPHSSTLPSWLSAITPRRPIGQWTLSLIFKWLENMGFCHDVHADSPASCCRTLPDQLRCGGCTHLTFMLNVLLIHMWSAVRPQ